MLKSLYHIHTTAIFYSRIMVWSVAVHLSLTITFDLSDRSLLMIIGLSNMRSYRVKMVISSISIKE
jgi:hypothetical protein